MTTARSILRNPFEYFWPRSALDPRSHLPVIKEQPAYYLGSDWTPTPGQIREAQERQKARRANPSTRWQAVREGPEFDAARAAIVCAADNVKPNDSDATQRNRALRKFAFDANATIFVRNLRVPSDRYLIELRHPRLRIDSQPVGFRFIGLSPRAWHRSDFVGAQLDGSADWTEHLFDGNFTTTVADADLAESYLRFALDHIEFAGGQFYLVCDCEDFIRASPDDSAAASGELEDPSLIAQFRVAMPDSEPVPGKVIDAFDVVTRHGLSKDGVIPPTTLRIVRATDNEPAHAIIFATIILDLQLYYTCLTVSAAGAIRSAGHERQVVLPGTSLPLVPVHSFDEQRRTLKRAIDQLLAEENRS